MNLYINNQPVAIKPDTVIDYTAENPLFTDTEGYTLEIIIPLRDSARNQHIFGALHRPDQPLPDIIYNARLEHLTWNKTGIIKIIEINEAELTVQFLDGIAAANADNRFDRIYINQAAIALPDTDAEPGYTDFDAIMRGGIDRGYKWVYLPWVNNFSGIVHNLLTVDATDLAPDRPYGRIKKQTAPPAGITTSNDTRGYQPYMLHVAAALLEAEGYTADFTPWQHHHAWRYLLCLNVVPDSFYAGNNYAAALPHMTYTDFFRQLGTLLGGHFIIDHNRRNVRFRFRNAAFQSDTINYMHIPTILDQHRREIKDDGTADNDNPQHTIIKFASTPGQLEQYYAFATPPEADAFNIIKINRWEDFLTHNAESIAKDSPTHLFDWDTDPDATGYKPENHTYYTSYIDTYDETTRRGTAHVVPVGYHGIPECAKDYRQNSIDFCPAYLDFANTANTIFCYFLNCGEKETNAYSPTADNPKTIQQTLIENTKEQTAYHDRIHFGFWCGELDRNITDDIQLHPATHHQDPAGSRCGYSPGFPLVGRYCNPYTLNLIHNDNIPLINYTQTLTVHFLRRTLPPVEAVYIVENRRYLCRRFNTQFTASPSTHDQPDALLNIEAELVEVLSDSSTARD